MYLIEGFTHWDSPSKSFVTYKKFLSSSLPAARAHANKIFAETGIIVAITKES